MRQSRYKIAALMIADTTNAIYSEATEEGIAYPNIAIHGSVSTKVSIGIQAPPPGSFVGMPKNENATSNK